MVVRTKTANIHFPYEILENLSTIFEVEEFISLVYLIYFWIILQNKKINNNNIFNKILTLGL